MTYVRVPVPRIPAGLGVNLLGVAGLAAIVCAIGALTSWKWGLLAAGVFAVALTVLAQWQSAPASEAASAPVAPPVKSRIEIEAERILADSAARRSAVPATG